MGAQFIEPPFKRRFIGRKSVASSDELMGWIFQADELYKDISQFVGESEWDSQTVAMIRKGLVDLKAFQHLELFDDGAAIVAAIDPEELRQFINTPQPSSKDPVVRKLGLIDRQFFAINHRESLVKLNAAWLRRQPNLIALSPEALRNELKGRGVYLPRRDKISTKT